MKKLVIILAGVLLCQSAFGQFIIFPEQDIYVEKENGLSVYKWTDSNEKVSEEIQLSCRYDWDGLVLSNCEGGGLLVDGLMHGKWELEQCGSSMGVRQEINYNRGLITGSYKVFVSDFGSSDTTMLYKTDFVNGTGIWKNFHGFLNDFSIRETGFYKDGKKSGEWCYYTAEGDLSCREYYDEGVLIKREDFEMPEDYEPYLNEDNK